MGDALAAPGLLERDGELTRVGELLAGVVERGEGAALLIEGPPGIGKSTLLAIAVERARAAGATVQQARGVELELGLAFGGVRQLFGSLVGAASAEDRERLLAGPVSLAAAALGLGALPARGIADPLYGLYWLSVNLAETAPVVLAVDDLHWLDEESARFVAYVAQRLGGVPLAVLATARPREPGAHDELVQSFAEAATVIRPRPLTQAAVRRLVGEERAVAAHHVTGGNPLLVVELSRALAAAPGASIEDLGPITGGASTLRRIRRISGAAVALAEAVALFPDGARLDDAAAIARLAPEAAVGAADALVQAEILTAAPRLAFAHPVLRTAVYEQIGPFARQHGHRQAARLLRDRDASGEELAAHLLVAEPAGDAEAVRILRAAADAALARAAPRAAARYLERALAEPPAPDRRAAMRHELGRLQAMLGRPEAPATLRRALEETRSPEQRADVVRDLALSCHSNERYGEAVREILSLQASAELDPGRRLVLDRLLAECAMDAGTDPGVYRQAVARLPDDLPGDTAAERIALVWVAREKMHRLEPVEEVLKLLERSLGDDVDAEFGFGGDLTNPVQMLIVCGALDTAQALAEERGARARENGAEAAYAAAQRTLGWIAVMRGDLRDGEAIFRLALDAPALQPIDASTATKWLATLLTMQGRLDEATAVMDALVRQEPDSFAAALIERRRAEIALARRDFAAALPVFAGLHEAARVSGVRSPPELLWLQDYAEALAGVGRRAEAIELMESYLADAQRFGETLALGTAHLSLGRLHEGATAHEHLEQAHALLAPSPFRWNAARAQLELGAALRRDNHRVRARPLLQDALEYAVRQDVRAIAERATSELRRAGSRPRHLMTTGVAALTPSEGRIAGLAADGLTNKEIAQELFLTVKTIESHLASAYRKLDVRSRRQLAAALGADSGS